jgi:phage tail-like protein
MTCVPEATFRLLDARVGWARRASSGLAGFRSGGGITLAPKFAADVSPADVLPYFFPPRLSLGASRCEWLLAPKPHGRRLLRYQPWATRFEPWGPELVSARSVASDCHRVVVADAGARRVLLLDFAGNVRADISVARPGTVAIAPWQELLVAARGRVWRYGLGGDRRGSVGRALGRVIGLRATYRRSTRDDDEPGEIWIAHRRRGRLFLSCFDRVGRRRNASPARLAPTFAPVGIRSWDRRGFCWTDATGPVAPCLDWSGCPSAAEIAPFPLRRGEREGWLLIEPLDGGDPRTVWHRVRVDADVPVGTAVAIVVATADEVGPVDLDRPGSQTATPGQLDFLVQQPPGRYLALRLTLTGDGRLTPRVRQVRVDFPRVTSADLLPAVYREEPRAADFTERFTALFDAELERLDRAIERFPLTLDVAATDDAYLSWLGGLIGLTFDEGWTPEQRRALVREAPRLFARRGTPRSLARVLEIATGERPGILEDTNQFGALPRPGQSTGPLARVGGTRLFGRNARRLRLGRSALGSARVHSYGNPDADPLLEGAYRFSVSVPPAAGWSGPNRARVEALVEALKPAHTIGVTRFGAQGFVLGPQSTVGVDTALVGPPPPILRRSIRLSRFSVLWPSARARGPGLLLDHPVVGIGTSL